MAFYIAKAVVERVGIDLGLQMVSGVVTCARNISGIIGFIKVDDDKSELIHLLKRTDIEVTVVILECIVTELDVDENTPNSVINGLKSLHEVLSWIENELTIIKERVEYNRSLYFLKHWRSYGFTSNIKHIEDFMGILENRKKLLFETIEISNSLKKGHINKSILEGTWIIPGGEDQRDNLLRQLQASKLLGTKPGKNTKVINISNNSLEMSDPSVLDEEFVCDKEEKNKKVTRFRQEPFLARTVI